VLPDQRLQDRRQIQLLLLQDVFFLGARFAQVELLTPTTLLNVCEMNSGRLAAGLALHELLQGLLSIILKARTS
jgi:hypothetical protein